MTRSDRPSTSRTRDRLSDEDAAKAAFSGRPSRACALHHSTDALRTVAAPIVDPDVWADTIPVVSACEHQRTGVASLGSGVFDRIPGPVARRPALWPNSTPTTTPRNRSW